MTRDTADAADLEVVIDLRERVVVNLVGELDLLCGVEFDQHVLPAVRGRSARDVVIDCTDVGFVDLRGLDLLLQVSLAALPHGPGDPAQPERGAGQAARVHEVPAGLRHRAVRLSGTGSPGVLRYLP